MSEPRKSVSENIKLVSFIVTILSIGITVGIFSQKITNVEAVQESQQSQISKLNDAVASSEVHWATVDANISNLSKEILKYDVTINKQPK